MPRLPRTPNFAQRVALRRPALVAATLAGLFLVAELAFRAWLALAPPRPGARFVADPACEWKLSPGPFWEDGAYRDDIVNSLGFRDREHDPAKRPGTHRVIGIGDSFVLGSVPISQNFLRVAERAADSSRCEMLLMGLGGYGPVQELGVLRSVALDLDPDLVVLSLYAANDVQSAPVHGVVLHGDVYMRGSGDAGLSLLRTSRLLARVEHVLLSGWHQAFLPVYRSGRAEDSLASDPSPVYLLILSHRLPVYARRPTRRMEQLWAETESLLVAFDRTCRAASVPWILLLVPSEEQVDAATRGRLLEHLNRREADYVWDRPHARLTAMAKREGIDVLDLLPLFRERAERGDTLYIPNETHWNVAGNRLAGEILGARIRSRFPPQDQAAMYAIQPGQLLAREVAVKTPFPSPVARSVPSQ